MPKAQKTKYDTPMVMWQDVMSSHQDQWMLYGSYAMQDNATALTSIFFETTTDSRFKKSFHLIRWCHGDVMKSQMDTSVEMNGCYSNVTPLFNVFWLICYCTPQQVKCTCHCTWYTFSFSFLGTTSSEILSSSDRVPMFSVGVLKGCLSDVQDVQTGVISVKYVSPASSYQCDTVRIQE